jgi:hypothetical protein
MYLFFILLCINLTLYIATGFSYYNGNMKMAIIYGVIGLIFSLLTINFYRNKRKRHVKKKKDDGYCGDCGNIGGVDCFDMNRQDGFDCIDIECGNFDIFELDCGGADCGGIDCNCSP